MEVSVEKTRPLYYNIDNEDATCIGGYHTNQE